MAANGNGNSKSVVVLQLSGGNDALNTLIPYNEGLYYDQRPYLGIPQDEVLHLDNNVGLNPAMGPIKSLWDEGKVAVIQGVGYPNPNRSHFRSMDVWHTAQPADIAPEGWLGQAIRDLDPKAENVVTGVNFGRGLPRAMYAKDVPVASVGNLETYGLMPDIKDEAARALALEAFSQIYGGSGKDTISQFISQVGMDALKGADILKTAPGAYSSSVEYADNPIAENMKNIAQVMFADVGTRIFYTQHGSFDTHANELASHAKLWNEVSTAVADFMDDLKEHGKDKDTVILLFSEFGRRINDNGAGTDHGSGGVAFVIGGDVNGDLYADFPSLRPEDQLEGDMHFSNDFRMTYSTILDRQLGIDPEPITNGNFEQFDFLRN